jgi:hypothetical protein
MCFGICPGIAGQFSGACFATPLPNRDEFRKLFLYESFVSGRFQPGAWRMAGWTPPCPDGQVDTDPGSDPQPRRAGLTLREESCSPREAMRPKNAVPFLPLPLSPTQGIHSRPAPRVAPIACLSGCRQALDSALPASCGSAALIGKLSGPPGVSLSHEEGHIEGGVLH